jgi:transcription-repair coupling factor
MWKTYTVAANPEATHQTLAILDAPLQNHQGAVLWILENNKQIKIYADLLKTWQSYFALPNKILTWPDTEQPDLETLTNLYKNQSSIILTTINNLDLPIASWQYLQKNKLQLQVGQIIDLNQLPADLVALGLERSQQAWTDNSFSVKGGLIDVYQNQKIYRFNVWQNKIEQIEIIDPLQMGEIKVTDSIDLWPNKIVAREIWTNNPTPHSLLITEHLLAEHIKALDNQKIIFDPLAKKTDDQFVTEPLNNVFSKTKERLDFLTTKKDWQIFWFTKNKTAAKEICQQANIQPNFIDWQQGLSWPTTFAVPAQKIVVLNDSLFFWSEEIKKQRQQRQKFTPDFKIGDLVVHRDHGIATLTKIKMMEIDDVQREFLVLTYAQNDTLFVPIDLADKVEKYVGPANPKIQRLSRGNTWPQTLKKIKQETWILANQLLIIEATRKLHKTPIIKDKQLEKSVADDFEFTPTASQQNAIAEVLQDLQTSAPCDRLICGDVGFGKTEIAVRAAAATIDNGWQVALLCPTTILAQQHYDLFIKRLEKYGVKIALLTRWQDKKQIDQAIKDIQNNKIDIIIGTHRILSRDIKIPRLQLLIIDEEQNFGVEDKEKLKKQKSQINVLTLSATPIPRTLNMALSMIKDISLITDPINNRKNIITQVAPINDEIIQKAIAHELARQGQVYFLHNRVETINLAYKKIKKLFPKNKISIAHGQLDDKTLAQTMHDFDTGQTEILVCSTIIANGLDIANANTLIVTDAEKFGLSQLHQLRGRIGRSDRQAHAYLLYSAQKLKTIASQRLAHLKLASGLGDGFKIANKDLELRGVGQILGKAQSGKVKSIGLGLYQQLIAETVAEIKGQKNKPWRDIELKLNLPTDLPKSFFKQEEEKLSFYQKISRLKDISEIKQALKKITNSNHQNILWLQKIRILAQNTDITNIQIYKNRDKEFLRLNFLHNLDYKKLDKLLTQNPHWRHTNNQIKIDKNLFSHNFQIALEKLIEFWEK